MKRRNFIQASSFLLPSLFGSLSARAFAAPASPLMQALFQTADNNDRVLVVIQLSGGNDGLNTVIPLDQMARYQSIRSNIALTESKILKLDGYSATGLHPAMTGMQQLFNEGKVSLVHSTSYNNPSFSHFRANDIWFTAVDSNQTSSNGWLGRYIETRYTGYPTGYPNTQNPDPMAIQIGYLSSTALLGSDQSVAVALPDPDTFARLVGDKPNTTPGGVDVSIAAGRNIQFLRQQQVSSVAYAGQIQKAAGKGKNQVTYPTGNSLADQLKIVARLIHGGLQTKVYYVTLGGFDTHASQTDLADTSIGAHANLLKNLSDGVALFQRDLKTMGIEDKVIGMTFSEFGRRADSNNSRGTDHGWAAPMFVFGSGVKTQVIGKNPNLSDLQNNNIKIQTDFRQVYAAILEDWFEASDSTETAVLLRNFEPVSIFRRSAITAIEPSAADFMVYPNPAVGGEMTLTSPVFAQKIEQIQLSDLAGRQQSASAQRRSSTEIQVDLRQVPTGRYVVQVQVAGQVLSKVVEVR
jgi:uncharacterized protein (DUF1501 family)